MTAPATPPRGFVAPAKESLNTTPAWTVAESEALLRSLPGISSARLLCDADGAVREVHVLATTELSPKQIVRNVESAMLARFGVRLDHRAISVAQSATARVAEQPPAPAPSAPAPSVAPVTTAAPAPGRGIYFEDVEVRRSRSAGLSCTVTLRAGAEKHTGEASGAETSRARGDLAATAAVRALAPLLADGVTLAFEACSVVAASDRTFAFVVVSGRSGRETTILSGSCEIREGLETAAALAVLDATERWMERGGAR
ncbi:MAG TPA: hypothetical protein VHM30_00520 [Gemmatimonadaceae bacterium]|nr:hypothetical protein [Gemmatimonadaceae bacterium]